MSRKTRRIALLGATAALALAVDVAHAQVGGEGIGDFVWEDLNQNGIQDAGEPGIAGVQVDLFRNDSGYTTVIATDTTDAGGAYLLEIGDGNNIYDFIVEFALPPGFLFSPPDQGPDASDSDVIDPSTGRTGVIFGTAMPTDAPILTVDAGMYRIPPNGVPEPGTLALVGLGLAGLAWKRKQAA